MSARESSRSNTREIEPHVAALLAAAGRPTIFTLEQLAGGRNNRTFRVRAGGGDAMLKWYFSDQRDERDRLKTEFDFASCCWRHGIRRLAQPLGMDPAVGLGLFEFLPGRPLVAGSVTGDHQTQAIAFLQEINGLRAEPAALELPNASEACFSLAAHVETIAGRLRRLANLESEDDVDREVVEFVRSVLYPKFDHHRAELNRWAASEQLDPRSELATRDRCLSPSDFGFHNALLADDGTLRFVDFEYAGWDDPAKLAGDFFCQIELPAPPGGFDAFLAAAAQLSARPEAVVQRTHRLFPLYQIKWCCIVLNGFLPTGKARRSFSEPRSAEPGRAEVLALARRLADRVGCVPGLNR